MAARPDGHRATTYQWGDPVHLELDLPVTDGDLKQAALVMEGMGLSWRAARPDRRSRP
jgi:hypothetical protein